MNIFDIEQTLVRNKDIISPDEAAVLGSTVILIAGCGSVGGAVVEPLIRMGLNSVVLADPEDFDMSNLNRQSCTLHDIDKRKVSGIEKRIRAIKPYAEVRTFSDGLTLDSLDDACDGVSLIFDGIDVSAAPMVKYKLHEYACRMRIPVLCGMDFGGKAVIYIFDYRRKKSRPFYGRAKEKDHAEGNLVRCLSWLGYSSYQTEFLPIIANRLITKESWPQVAYCVQAMSALGCRATLDVLSKRKVPHIVSFDTHQATRNLRDRWFNRFSYGPQLMRTFLISRSLKSAETISAEQDQGGELKTYLNEHSVLKQVLELMILAPSPHNAQPWHFVIINPNQVEIYIDHSKTVDYVDPKSEAAMMSVGCLIETASLLVDVRFEQNSDIAPITGKSFVGTLNLMAPKNESFAQNRALIRSRKTERSRFIPTEFPIEMEHKWNELIADRNCQISLKKENQTALLSAIKTKATSLFRNQDYRNELIAFFRLDKRAEQNQPSGFSANALSISKFEAKSLKLILMVKWVRIALEAIGLHRILSYSATKNISETDQFLLMATSDWSLSGQLNAGRSLMRVWIDLTRRGYSCQPVDFPISDKEGRDSVGKLFGLHSSRPFVLLRVGRTAKAKPFQKLRFDVVECSSLLAVRRLEDKQERHQG